jgi:DNA-binding transcriptional regulator YiaG
MVIGKPWRGRWDGARVKALRGHLDLTQTEMAARLGTRQQTISEWEKGMYTPRGTSATLLSIVADGSGFKYDAADSSSKVKTQKSKPKTP